ncbi:MFS general substrate transporter [Acephala macrosclerotiorum]|nr:MFS general substrate transporter [Acephala macrosclerotiorum]
MENKTEDRPEEILPSEKGLEATNTETTPPPSTPSDGVDSEHRVGHQSDDDIHIDLSWRSWVVVFISCFAVMAQVFVVVGASNVIAFIIRDLGEPALVGWIIQGPLLVQATLSPIMGRISDTVDRRYLASIPPIIAFVGAVVSAKATTMSTLIGGGILIGFTLATISIVQAIPSEVLPMKYRPLANGFAFVAGSLGGLIGVLGGGGLTNASINGWRGIYWMQAAFHIVTSISLLAFYWPKKPVGRSTLSTGAMLWSFDPIGSFLFISSATLLLLGLDWAGGSYAWHDAHVAATLGVGGGLLVMFCLYEWKGRDDGLVPHVYFKGSPNFILSVFAFAVEGWIFFSAVNSVTTQIVLNLGFESSAWKISIRQLSFNLVNIFACIPLTWYATKYKDMKVPLLFTFTLFLIVCICYSTITPAMNHAQIGYNVISAIGQAGPLTFLVALVQFTAPHAYLANATGLAFSARAIGGAFGSAVVDVIINNKLSSTYASQVSAAAIGAGLPATSIAALLTAFGTGAGFDEIPGITDAILGAASDASHHAYAAAYRLAWASIIPFVVLAIVAVACLKGVKELMTEHVDATVERVHLNEDTKA